MSVKRELVRGTLILTAAGLIARLLGLLNRIYLANLISNAELGRYQLIFPVFMFCMALSSTGMQVAVSKMVSSFHAAGKKSEIRITVIMAGAWSLGLSLVCSAILYWYADFISVRILNENACGPYLRILALALPFAAMHNCISGYFYGRMSAAMEPAGKIRNRLWKYAGLLTVNRVSVTMLQSTEMILIPMMLARYCGSSNRALELFGVITGIVMPVISFPNTVTNALSTLLLPTVSEAETVHNYRVIADTCEKSIQYCLLMGIFACLLFAIYGGDMGVLLFDDVQAGYYIRLFAVLCPLMYIQSLLAGTLNGLGKMNETLMHHVIASAIRIAGILLLVPEMGIQGYVAGIFLANAVVTAIAQNVSAGRCPAVCGAFSPVSGVCSNIECANIYMVR